MKLLIDFFPVLLFFIAYKAFDIYIATVVAIVSSVVQVVSNRLRHKRYENMQLVTLGLIVILGGATLLLHNELFIKWKPSIVNWLFGLAFLLSHFIGKQPLIKRMMGSMIQMPVVIWSRLNLAWGVFFLFLGLLNVYVIYQYDTDTWVNFKLFGMLGLTFAFVIVQSLYISRYIAAGDSGKSSEKHGDS
jgi:intracellular septation protein